MADSHTDISEAAGADNAPKAGAETVEPHRCEAPCQQTREVHTTLLNRVKGLVDGQGGRTSSGTPSKRPPKRVTWADEHRGSPPDVSLLEDGQPARQTAFACRCTIRLSSDRGYRPLPNFMQR